MPYGLSGRWRTAHHGGEMGKIAFGNVHKICIYMYICRERERKREKIYMYIYREMDREIGIDRGIDR